MKPCLLLAVCFYIFSCRDSKEQTAQRSVKSHLEKTLHDFKSYEPVSFSKVDSSFFTYDQLESTQEFRSQLKNAEQQLNEKRNYISKFPNSAHLFVDDEKRLSEIVKFIGNVIDTIRMENPPKFNGWRIDHSFRANNLLGGKRLNNYTFYLDSSLKSVLSQEEIK